MDAFELQMDLAGRRYGGEWLEMAAWYRHFSLNVVNNPDRVLAMAGHPLVLKKIEAEFTATTRQRAEMFEAMAYGDPSFLLTTPGPSLSGVLLQSLGDDWQCEFFARYVIEHRSRTFFAVTEPTKGSDAANLQTRLVGGRKLSGEKLLFGNGAVAPIGTVLARSGDGPLDMVAILLPPDRLRSGAVTARVLDMFAMHGAQLSSMRFDDLHIPEELILGRHRKPMERGLMGMVKTFHRFRPGVAGMAIGHGQALVDYARQHFVAGQPALRDGLDEFDHLLATVRALNLAAASQVDRDPLRGAAVSLAKSKATHAVEEIARRLSRQLPAAALVEHPWLTKALADVYAYEYMEGTTPIQLGHVFTGYRRGELDLRARQSTGEHGRWTP